MLLRQKLQWIQADVARVRTVRHRVRKIQPLGPALAGSGAQRSRKPTSWAQSAAGYLPARYINYAIPLTFVLLVFGLATRLTGLRAEQPLFSWLLLRRVAVGAVLILITLVPWLFSPFRVSSIGVETVVLGIAVASLIFS